MLRRLRFSLEEICRLLCTGPEQWAGTIRAQLAEVRSEARLLAGIEQELLALQNRIGEGQEPYLAPSATATYNVDTFRLLAPVQIIGQEARLPYSRREAVDRETLTNRALEGAYSLLYNEWLPQSGYSQPAILAVEVYREHHMEAPVNPGMELWQLLPNEEGLP
ncbi:MAG: hypothetical protein K0Q90_1049 [Paenibacillaceae bacterium]|jgi:hypothetical protein|nr:hypothetical protein [Paenibacillaceae bacterium]